MPAAPEKTGELRRQLAERFPTAPRVAARAPAHWLAAIDDTAGGLPLGAVTESSAPRRAAAAICCSRQLLAVTRATRTRVALVDATDSFDPSSFPVDLLAHLLWVRCTARDALPHRPAHPRRQPRSRRPRPARSHERELRRTPASFCIACNAPSSPPTSRSS